MVRFCRESKLVPVLNCSVDNVDKDGDTKSVQADYNCFFVPRCGRTGGWTGRVSGRTRGRIGDQGSGGIDEQGGQVGGQGNEGNNRNQSGNAVNDNIQGDVRNVIVNNGQRVCSYKNFLACNLKEYDRKGGAIVYTHWIEKMESVQDMSGCGDNQKVKYIAGSFVGKALTWWNSQIYTRSRETAVGMA
ncbi:hypothetical protein Tco_0942884 [Tanacetum coccineum]